MCYDQNLLIMAGEKDRRIFLPLEGVESEHCAMILDNAFKKADGIISHKIELNNRRAVIESDEPSTVLPRAVKIIRDLGYGVPTVKKSFPVLQMSCASCAVSAETSLKRSTGVVSAAVNFASATAMVEYIPGMTGPDKLKKEIQKAGYDLITGEGSGAGETLEEINDNKFRVLKWKTIWAIILSLPVMITGMFFMEKQFANYFMWALSTPVLCWFGKDFFINAWKQAKHRSANMDTLVAMSTGVAYLFSVFNTLLPHFLPEKGMHPHVYFEASSVVIAFILLGRLLEERAKRNTSASIKKLMGLQPKTAMIVNENGEAREVPMEEVRENSIVIAKPGERIAFDGRVLSGTSYVDESAMTGEPVARAKKEGDVVLAGTINQTGNFRYKAEKVGSATLLGQIIRLVRDAQGSKAPVQKLVDKIAGIFVPVVIFISIVSFLTWWIWGDVNGFSQGLMAFVTVLVIACPCALGLATPTAIMVGIGKGAEKGILIKNAESLETAKRIDTVVLDKTGTITEGKPQLSQIQWLKNDSSGEQVLYSIEKLSEHPMAEAVAGHFKQAKELTVTDFAGITGKGVRGKVNGEYYFAGNKKLMDEQNISLDENLLKISREWISQAKSVIWFSNSHHALAVISVNDRIKETSNRAIQQLMEMNIEVHMLTGDNEETAKSIARQAGITHYRAEMLPQDKYEFVKKLQEKGKIVAIAGDGINDSAALAQANVSIAMGKGSDIAMEIAQMTIISSDLNRIPEAIRLSKQTVATIRQNLFWAFFYNIIGIPVAAGILFPFTGFLLNPMIAGAAMAMSSVSVVGNSLRLKWKR